MAKQDKRPERIDTSSDRGALTDNPFGALAARLPGLPEAPHTPESEPAATPATRANTPFRIERTRKGGFPVFLEKRPNGKNVTVIRNISGDLDALVVRLKKLCGAGGTVREGAVELQGDHREKVEAFLRENAGR
jgi:translation initiation factor 1